MAMNMAPRIRLVRLHVRPATWHCHARALSAHGAPVSPDRGGPRPESRGPGHCGAQRRCVRRRIFAAAREKPAPEADFLNISGGGVNKAPQNRISIVSASVRRQRGHHAMPNSAGSPGSKQVTVEHIGTEPMRRPGPRTGDRHACRADHRLAARPGGAERGPRGTASPSRHGERH